MTELLTQLGRIFYFVVLPVLLTAGVGFLVQRRLGLDLDTLRRLNFFVTIPALVYVSIVTADVTAREVLTAAAFVALLMALMAALTLAAARLRGVPADQVRPLLLTTLFYNSGNFGLPVQELAFSPLGLGAAARALQVFIMLPQNLLQFTLGLLLISGGEGRGRARERLHHLLRFPPLYAIVAGLLTLQIRRWLGDAAPGTATILQPAWQMLRYLDKAFVAVALVTLGAQLAEVRWGARRYPVGLSVGLRLLVGPALAAALLVALRAAGVAITPFQAQVLLVGSSSPTAVNSMLMCLEFDAHPDYAAQSVFWSTVLSPVTVTLSIYLAQSGILFGAAALP